MKSENVIRPSNRLSWRSCNMTQPSRPLFLAPPFFKRSALTLIISLLVFCFYQVSEAIIHPFGRTQLPGSDHPLQIYSNQTQDDLTQLYLHAINKADRSITLVIYSLTDRDLIRALNDKSRAGIPLYIVCDATASPDLSQKLPWATIVRRSGKGLTHQKILCIDDTLTVLGSANLTGESLKLHGNLVFVLDNQALTTALTSKIKSMDQYNGSTPLLHQTTQMGEQTVELWILPDDPDAVKRMITLFRSAKKSIKVAMFAWTRIDFTQELIRAAARGVKVEVVIDRSLGKGAGAKIVRMLSESGIPVALSTGKGLLHHKFAYIDDDVLVNGSANWTGGAFKFNDDCFIIAYPLTTDQRKKMNSLWDRIRKQSEPLLHPPTT
jgi:cardiolipin synthase